MLFKFCFVIIFQGNLKQLIIQSLSHIGRVQLCAMQGVVSVATVQRVVRMCVRILSFHRA